MIIDKEIRSIILKYKKESRRDMKGKTISNYQEEALDGDEAEDLAKLVLLEIDREEGNLTPDEYIKRLELIVERRGTTL